jgi:integrase
VERICGALRPRDAQFVQLLAYAGLRPGEARALRWARVGERTLTVHAPKTRRHRVEPRSVQLLAPLAQDLRECRLACGRPGDEHPVVPGHEGSEWSEVGYELCVKRVCCKALRQVGLTNHRAYDLRHSYASLLLDEWRVVGRCSERVRKRPSDIRWPRRRACGMPW